MHYGYQLRDDAVFLKNKLKQGSHNMAGNSNRTSSYSVEPVEDMINLAELTEQSVLENLKRRYEKELIYVLCPVRVLLIILDLHRVYPCRLEPFQVPTSI